MEFRNRGPLARCLRSGFAQQTRHLPESIAVTRKRRSQSRKARDPAKIAAKAARREERKARQAAERARALRRKRVKQAAIGAIVLVVVGVAGFGVFRVWFPSELAGVEKPASLGRGHVAQGQTAQYATPTPTSGIHAASSARCGIFTQQIPAGLAVHALEHGTVVIWYRPDVEEQLGPGLREIVGEFDDRVILAPNADLVQPVVATAWNRLKAYEGADPEIQSSSRRTVAGAQNASHVRCRRGHGHGAPTSASTGSAALPVGSR